MRDTEAHKPDRLTFDRDRLTGPQERALRTRIARYAKQAARVGMSAPVVQVEPYQVTEPAHAGPYAPKVVRTYYRASVTADTAYLCRDGYRLAGIAQTFTERDVRSGDPVMIMRTGDPETGPDLSTFRVPSRLVCAECGKPRRRKTVLLIEHTATGTVKPYGTDCASVYVPTEANALANLLAYLSDVATRDDDPDAIDAWHRSYVPEYPRDDLVARAVWLMDREPYLKGHDGSARRLRWFYAPPGDKDPDAWRKEWDALRDAWDTTPDTERDALPERAARVVAWARSGSAGRSDFAENLRAAVSLDLVPPKAFGLVCCLPHVHNLAEDRERVRRTEKAARPPERFVGTPKERGTWTGTLTTARPFDNGYSGGVRYVIHEDTGGVLVWRCSGDTTDHPEPGDRVRITGTVKRHETYRDTKQTALTRCRLEKAEE